MEQNELNLYAKTLRKNMTEEEKHIWYDFLSSYPVKFRRQKVIGNYIADFYCAKANLVIEIDGSQHYDEQGRRYDTQRTEFFKNKGIEVIRFLNSDINERFESVCNRIDKAVKKSVIKEKSV